MSDPASNQNPSSPLVAWTASEGGTSVRIPLDIVERMLQDVMRGFGVVPKRGAEVGGILLGRVGPAESGRGVAIRVEDYRTVPIGYSRGPSYLLSEKETQTFDQVLGEAHRQASPKPVGFFRSHTREADGLTAEDAEFCGRRFPDPWAAVLLIKPKILAATTAAIVVKRDGRFPEGASTADLPFKPREDRPRRRERRSEEEVAVATPVPAPPAPVPVVAAAEAPAFRTTITAITPEIAIPRSTAFDWLHKTWLVVLLLAIGAALGYLTRTWLDMELPVHARAYRLRLSAATSGDDVVLRWDPASPSIARAWRAVLVIDDGTSHRDVDLNPTELKSGRLIYRHITNAVTFRLDVFPQGNVRLSETLQWNQ